MIRCCRLITFLGLILTVLIGSSSCLKQSRRKTGFLRNRSPQTTMASLISEPFTNTVLPFGQTGICKRKNSYAYEQDSSYQATCKGVEISFNGKSDPPKISVIILLETSRPSSVKFSFSDQDYPWYDITGSKNTFSIPTSSQKVYVNALVSVATKISDPGNDYKGLNCSLLWQGEATFTFATSDLLEFGELDRNRFGSMEIFDVIRPSPIVRIAFTEGNSSGILDTLRIHELTPDHSVVLFPLPSPAGCRTYYVTTESSMDNITLSRWYVLPPTTYLNDLIPPILPSPILEVELSPPQDMNLSNGSEISLSIRVSELLYAITDTRFLVCQDKDETFCFTSTQQTVTLTSKFNSSSGIRVKVFRNETNSGWEDSCFTEIPEPIYPEIKQRIRFPSLLEVSAIFAEPTFDIKQSDLQIWEENKPKQANGSSVEIRGWVLCPSIHQLDASTARVVLQWRQQDVMFRQRRLINLREMALVPRETWCHLDPSASILRWAFAGITPSCHVEFHIRFTFLNHSGNLTTQGNYEPLNASFWVDVPTDEYYKANLHLSVSIKSTFTECTTDFDFTSQPASTETSPPALQETPKDQNDLPETKNMSSDLSHTSDLKADKTVGSPVDPSVNPPMPSRSAGLEKGFQRISEQEWSPIRSEGRNWRTTKLASESTITQTEPTAELYSSHQFTHSIKSSGCIKTESPSPAFLQTGTIPWIITVVLLVVAVFAVLIWKHFSERRLRRALAISSISEVTFMGNEDPANDEDRL